MEVSNQNYMDEAVFKEVRKKGLLAFGVTGGVLPVALVIFGAVVGKAVSRDLAPLMMAPALFCMFVFIYDCFVLFEKISQHTNSKIYSIFKSWFLSLIAIIISGIVMSAYASKFGDKITIVFMVVFCIFIIIAIYKWIRLFVELKNLSDEKLFLIYVILLVVSFILYFLTNFLAYVLLFGGFSFLGGLIKFLSMFDTIGAILPVASFVLLILAWYRVKYFKVLPKLAD
ncbi:MAG: hypothetical protein IKI43_00035 [Campylobacter sp.]|nr:hypothetical protein [Campylobacter sp.]